MIPWAKPDFYGYEEKYLKQALKSTWISDGSFVKKIEKLIPLGRMAQIDEYRAAIQFLCSDDSKYMTGQNIVIDGGRSVW